MSPHARWWIGDNGDQVGVSQTFRELTKIYFLKICVLQKSYLLWEFQTEICTCAQSNALGTRTKFQLEIITINVFSGIVYFREIILESSRYVSETTPRTPAGMSLN